MALKILHLEDDESDMELVGLALRQDALPCDIRHASSRDAFVAALDADTFDVILSDFHLPGYDGLQAMAEAQKRCPDTPFVFVSGTAGENLVVECLKAGGTDFVLKSQLSRLGTAVRRAQKEAEDRAARRRAEVTLADSVRFAQSVIDATPSLVYVYDAVQGRNLFVNDEALRILGYTRAELAEMGPDLLGRLMHPDDVEASRKGHESLAGGERGEVREADFRLRSARGAWRWFHAREVAFESGAAPGARQVLGAAQDVTRAKLAERRRAAQYSVTRVLAESASWSDAVPRVLEALRQSLGAALAEIWDVAADGHALRFDRSVHSHAPLGEMWRQVSREITYERGHGLPGLVWETGAPYWGAALVRDRESPREGLLGDHAQDPAVAVPVRSAETTTAVIVLFGMAPAEDDMDLLALLEATGNQLGEFRERKRAEEQIREQAALLEHAREAIVVTDLDLRVTFWNKGADRLYGYTASEARGRDAALVFSWRPENELSEARQRLMSAGEWSGLVDHKSRGGRTMKVQSHWTLVRGPAGAPRSILIINADVTEAKRLEGDLLRAQRLDSLGVLAGGIAHDLNNVLAPILMSIESLRRKVTDERSQRMFQLLEASATRGADLVRQVLAFARGVEGQRLVLEPADLVHDLEKMLRDALPTSIQLALDLPAGLWCVRGDPTQLHQVLLNLCVNARDAMPAGGILAVSARNVDIDASFAGMNPDARPGPHVLLKVSDTGGGIEPAVLDRIFEPFFTTKEAGRGTGLGLSTAMTIVRGHQGFLAVASEPGRGTTFSVYLPASLDDERRLAEEADHVSPQGQGELILVADDEGAIREITKETLEASGYQVVTASDGAEAVGVCASRSDVAAVLMDVHMPVMDGPAASRALLRINPAIKVVAVSGYSSKEAQAMSAGARLFLAKPYTADQLLAIIRQALTA